MAVVVIVFMPVVVVMFVVMMVVFVLVIVSMIMVVPMFVVVLVIMFMVMILVMAVLMILGRVSVMLRIIIAGGMLIRTLQFYYGAGAGDAVPLVPDKFKFPAPQAKLFQLPPQNRGIGPQINQGPQGHIAGDAGVTVKVQRLHDASSGRAAFRGQRGGVPPPPGPCKAPPW
jgi:hypothetical protein